MAVNGMAVDGMAVDGMAVGFSKLFLNEQLLFSVSAHDGRSKRSFSELKTRRRTA